MPILFLWAGSNFHRAKYANDPDYIYLVNAVAICDGKSVGHIDNPGTTIMQIEALTIAISHLISNPESESLVTQVLTDPDRFIEITRIVVLILNSLILGLLGWVAIRKTGSIWVALLLQAAVFITPNTLNHLWTKVSPEPILFLVTCLFVVTILSFNAEREKTKLKYVLYFALLSGAGLGTKATFLPLVIFPILVLPGLKRKLFYLGGTIISFVLFTIPAIPEYKNMYYWFRNLISHSGIYGQGDRGIIDTRIYLPNILAIITNNIVFSFTVGVSLILLIRQRFRRISKNATKKRDWNYQILLGLVASELFAILIVAKHYHANHYLIPVLLLTGITAFFTFKIILKEKRSNFLNKATYPALAIVLIVLLGWKQPAKMEYANYGYRITNEEIDSVNIVLNENYSDFQRIYYYPNSLNKYSALNFGDVYAKRKMLPYLKELYPHTYFYNFDNNQFTYWNAEITLEEIINFNSDSILLIGGPLDTNLLKPLEKRNIPLRKIHSGRIQAVYMLDTARYNTPLQNEKHQLLEIITCGAEVISSDNEFFLGSNGTKFKNAFAQSGEFSRTGDFSIQLNRNTEYAAEYIIDDLKAGDEYEIQVWRKGQNCSASLVVAALNTQLFYKAESDYLSSEGDWNLLRIKFKITPEMENEKLKVYLWNSNKEICWFDDLEIKRNSIK